jgi:hypothetical protein
LTVSLVSQERDIQEMQQATSEVKAANPDEKLPTKKFAMRVHSGFTLPDGLV